MERTPSAMSSGKLGALRAEVYVMPFRVPRTNADVEARFDLRGRGARVKANGRRLHNFVTLFFEPDL